MTNFSILCQHNGGCMGCCGHDFGSKKNIKLSIAMNTKEFEVMNPQSDPEKMRFRDRFYIMDLRNGVCRNLIEVKDKFFCPLHPACNGGRDLRQGHCDTAYLCQTAKQFDVWDEDRKRKFLKFIDKQKLGNLDYSIKIDDGSLIKEFTASLK